MTPDPTDAISKLLTKERLARGWSLSELAQHAAVSKAMISKIERGEASPTGGRREADLRLLHHKPRQGGGEVGHGQDPLADTHPLEHQRHRDRRVPHEHYPWVDHAAIALAAEDGSAGEHLIYDVGLADGRDVAGHAMAGGDRGGHPAR